MWRGAKGYPVDDARKDAFRPGCPPPNRLRPASKGRFKRFGRCVPTRFCRVRGAVGEEKGRLKTLSSRRQTAMPSSLPIGLSDAFADDTTKQTQWRAFLNKNKLEPMELRDVIGAIRARATQFGFPSR